MKCRHCDAEMGDKEQCPSCGHRYVKGMLIHDRYCCDRIYQGTGGAEGSTATSRTAHAAAVADRDAKQ